MGVCVTRRFFSFGLCLDLWLSHAPNPTCPYHPTTLPNPTARIAGSSSPPRPARVSSPATARRSSQPPTGTGTGASKRSKLFRSVCGMRNGLHVDWNLEQIRGRDSANSILVRRRYTYNTVESEARGVTRVGSTTDGLVLVMKGDGCLRFGFNDAVCVWSAQRRSVKMSNKNSANSQTGR